ncbi:isochorismatase family protein [Entomobacter blattae]|uniref:Putative hydrolase YcaC n=1 Tax=Entomobacter blattae TaxID=2762277 RepID=A0A7H1NTW3_9PROT|nr:isochorismatase family protein [Entomobacter blattae]QNT79223.1 putative hydrolase YcaC [Entomobacter blattae]
MISSTYKRLDINKAATLFIDHQSGLMALATDIAPDEYANNISALVGITNLFGLPCVLTSSMEKGPNGPIVPCVKDNIKPDAYIQRDGQINAWDNEEFRQAVYDLVKKGRTQFILSGIVTDVCVAFVALSLLHEKAHNPQMKDIQVFIATDSSGTNSQFIREASWDRMSKAGAELMTWFAIACELRINWHPLPENKQIPMDDFAQLVIAHSRPYASVWTSYQANKK